MKSIADFKWQQWLDNETVGSLPFQVRENANKAVIWFEKWEQQVASLRKAATDEAVWLEFMLCN